MKFLMGIDIGTSACKIALFEPNGAVVAQQSCTYPVYYPHPGYAEQNPDEWWRAVCEAVRAVLEKSRVLPDEIACVGVDGQSWACVMINRQGGLIGPTPIWMDTRSARLCEEQAACGVSEKLFECCGNPLKPFYTTGKILWYKRHQPEKYRRIHKILQSNGYIVYRLTGEITQDLSQGYGLHLFDMRNGCWDEKAAALLGIDPSLLPPLYPCHEIVGTVHAQAAALTGLKKGTPVVAGGLDAACGALGAGVIHPGETQEQGGQAGGMSICLKEYRADKRLILSRHVVPGHLLLQGGTVGGGGALRWFLKEFGAGERQDCGRYNPLALLDEEAAAVPAGAGGLIFLPYLCGERSPVWNPYAKGIFYGIDYAKTRAHFIRATLEGVAFSLYHNLNVAEEAGAEVTVMNAMGGAANSRLWTQIKADVTGKVIQVPDTDTATALGAAILAGVGAGIYRSFEEAVGAVRRIKRAHEPDAYLHKQYAPLYQEYLALYDRLKGLMTTPVKEEK